MKSNLRAFSQQSSLVLSLKVFDKMADFEVGGGTFTCDYINLNWQVILIVLIQLNGELTIIA